MRRAQLTALRDTLGHKAKRENTGEASEIKVSESKTARTHKPEYQNGESYLCRERETRRSVESPLPFSGVLISTSMW